VIFLDEPTSGMGIDDIAEMKQLIHGLRRDYTVVLIEHNMDIVMDISDTITVMQLGRCWRRASRPRSAATNACAGPIWAA
jgi:branched-chain amino acid transport system ATP-binding protein